MNGVPADITENRLNTYFSKFELVENVSLITSKAGIVTGDFVLQVTMDRKTFLDIPDTLACRQCKTLVIVKSRRPHCWACGTAEKLFKAYCGKKPASQTKTTSPTEAARTDRHDRRPKVLGDWR